MKLHHLSALEQAEALRDGQISATELVNHYLERIDRLNPQVNAFTHVSHRRARKAAASADKLRRTTPADKQPLFLGVPNAIKDLVPTRGEPTRLGSRAYKYMIAPFDGAVAKHINAGGFISLGKLATSEFGVLPTTEPDIHPPTRNPWDQSRTSGGSSGGSSAAVAAGLVAMAHGSDGGGSVRIPSALCHLYGFKPSLSLLGNLHGKYNQLGLSVMGPLAQTVEDAAAMLDVMACHTQPHLDSGSCLAACERAPENLRIALLTETPVGEVDADVLAAVEDVARQLEALGHTVVPISGADATLEEFLPVWQYAVSGVGAIRESILMPVTQWLREPGRKMPFEDAERARLNLAQKIHQLMDGFDICLSPTVGIPAPRIGEFDDRHDPKAWFFGSAQLGGFTAPFNLTHGPAASLPAGLTKNNLPIGVQLASHPGQDHLVLSLSRQLEQVMPWRTKRCPMFDKS
ncbi:MAG: amidase [Bradymonadia bacterium]